jgi:hypothetical protein
VSVAADKSSIQYDHFKELGRFISVDLKEEKMKTEIRRRALSDMEAVETSGVNGLCKIFLYEHFVVRRLSWVFLVHDLNLWFAKGLDKQVIPRLKNWSGLFKSCDVGALFRRRDHLGLQLTSIEHHYQHMQLVKCCLLENSSDPKVQALYKLRKDRVSSFTRRWAAPKELLHLEPIADHNLKFAGQTGRAGLGSLKSDPYLANPTPEDRRSKITATLAAEREESYVRHASCLALQGVWSHWDNVTPFDLSWKNLIYGPGPRVISFVLNAQINSVRTPDMLKLWKYIEVATCPLCGAKQCTLHHILVNCKFSLNQGRYTWRHDSVLLNIENSLAKLLPTVNSRKPSTFAEVAKKDFKASFNAGPPKRCVLDYANDWELQVDFKTVS